MGLGMMVGAVFISGGLAVGLWQLRPVAWWIAIVVLVFDVLRYGWRSSQFILSLLGHSAGSEYWPALVVGLPVIVPIELIMLRFLVRRHSAFRKPTLDAPMPELPSPRPATQQPPRGWKASALRIISVFVGALPYGAVVGFGWMSRQFENIYTAMDGNLPWLTTVVMNLSRLVNQRWILYGLTSVPLWLMTVWYLNSSSRSTGRRIAWIACLIAPGVGFVIVLAGLFLPMFRILF